MRIFKFGGASIKDTNSIKNITSVLYKTGYHDVLIVISAMGKMTNAFEKLTNAYFYKKEETSHLVDLIKKYHDNIIKNLFADKKHPIFLEIESLYTSLSHFMTENSSTDYNYVYDQMVSIAELISTKIVSHFLNTSGIKNTWLDVRDCIKTNNDYRDAKVQWKETEHAIKTIISPKKLYITQGFIASDFNKNTTTLGREGSDYSAGIFAYCLHAESLTIWKDVEGVLNADPRYFKETQLLEQISYTEAIELAFYGASVIHPKTLQPLQKKRNSFICQIFYAYRKQGNYSRQRHTYFSRNTLFYSKEKSTITFYFITRFFVYCRTYY